MDEVFIKIRGKMHYLWRAVDFQGEVLDVLVRSRRNRKAAYKFFRKVLKWQGYLPATLVTDKYIVYKSVAKGMMPSTEHVTKALGEQPGLELAPTNTAA
jgi:putative transposase